MLNLKCTFTPAHSIQNILSLSKCYKYLQFSGKWIEVARYPQPIQRGQCNRAEYNNNGEIISIVATQVVDRKLQTSPGNAKIASSDGSGLLEVSLGEGDGKLITYTLINIILILKTK